MEISSLKKEEQIVQDLADYVNLADKQNNKTSVPIFYFIHFDFHVEWHIVIG